MTEWIIEYEDTQSGMTRYGTAREVARDKGEAIQQFNQHLGNMPGIYILEVHEVAEAL